MSFWNPRTGSRRLSATFMLSTICVCAWWAPPAYAVTRFLEHDASPIEVARWLPGYSGYEEFEGTSFFHMINWIPSAEITHQWRTDDLLVGEFDLYNNRAILKDTSGGAAASAVDAYSLTIYGDQELWLASTIAQEGGTEGVVVDFDDGVLDVFTDLRVGAIDVFTPSSGGSTRSSEGHLIIENAAGQYLSVLVHDDLLVGVGAGVHGDVSFYHTALSLDMPWYYRHADLDSEILIGSGSSAVGSFLIEGGSLSDGTDPGVGHVTVGHDSGHGSLTLLGTGTGHQSRLIVAHDVVFGVASGEASGLITGVSNSSSPTASHRSTLVADRFGIGGDFGATPSPGTATVEVSNGGLLHAEYTGEGPALLVHPNGTLTGGGANLLNASWADIIGSVENQGRVEPSGTLTIDGTYTETTAGELVVSISAFGMRGIGSGTGDRLAVTDGATLAGSLTISYSGGAPDEDTEAEILITDDLTGRHPVSYITLPTGLDDFSGQHLVVTYDTANDRVFATIVGKAGDLTGDGYVNTEDLNPFLQALTSGRATYDAGYGDTYGTSYYRADINGDGQVNTEDTNPFIALLTGGGQAAVIPEPAAIWTLGLGLLAAHRRRR